MTAINNLFLAAVMLPQLQASGPQTNSGGNTDVFAAMFKKAADSGKMPAETVQGAKPQSKQFAAVDLPKEQPLLELEEEPTDEIPDELIALMAATIPPVIQEQTPITVEVTTPDVIPAAEATVSTVLEPAIITDTAADTVSVVSSLESNKEIDAPTDNTANVHVQEFTTPVEIVTPEQTARMPQTTGQLELPEEDVLPKTNTAATIEPDVPCPLENENNSLEVTRDTPAKHENEQEKPKPDTRVFGNSQPVDISPERVIAADQLSQAVETAPPQTATVETLYNTLIDSIYTASTSESKYMEIQLKPEFLGKVAIQLTLGDAGLEIKIKANDAGVKGLIADQLTQLTSSLNDKGVKVTNVDVVFANVADHSYDGSAPHQQQPHQSGRSSQSTSLGFGIGFTEELDAVTIVDAGMASVEYKV